MGHQEKGRPEHRRSNSKMIVEVASAGTKSSLGLAVLVTAGFPEAFIGRLIVMREIQGVFDEWGAGIRVVANTIPSDPWVQERKC